MKTIVLIFVMMSFFTKAYVQDLLCTIEVQIEGEATPADSIRLNNLSNGTTLLLSNLPDSGIYAVNLTKGELFEPGQGNQVWQSKAFSAVSVLPGEVTILNTQRFSSDVRLSVFSLTGAKILTQKIEWSQGEVKRLQLNQRGLFIITLEVSGQFASFKAVGIDTRGDVQITSAAYKAPVLKAQTLGEGFSFSAGDSLEILVYKENYLADPVLIIVSENETIVVDLYEYVPAPNPVLKDSRDEQEYAIVEIGTQTWMAENLAYLPAVNAPAEISYTDARYYVYEYDGNQPDVARNGNEYQTYGVLYNWPAALTACPPGWRLPSDYDWMMLEQYLGLSEVEAKANSWRGTTQGKSLKATTGWNSNGNGTDEFGFAALPGGNMRGSKKFMEAGTDGYWWTANEYSKDFAWYRKLSTGMRSIYRDGFNRNSGFSVRCLKSDESVSLPEVETGNTSELTANSVILHGQVIFDGGEQLSARGFFWSASNPDPGFDNLMELVEGGTGAFQASLTDLEPNTTYYYRAFATNSAGTALGEVLSFKTLQETSTTVPTVTVEAATDITETSATLYGTIVSDGGSEIYYRGFYWSWNNPDPGFDDLLEIAEVSTNTFSVTLTELQPNTKYYFRTIAVNSEGVGMSEVLSFTTKEMQTSGTFVDHRDGQEYKYVTIGNQVWMAENLKYLPKVIGHSTGSETLPYYYVNLYDGTNVAEAKATTIFETYGALYNWPAAVNACPGGWHLPSDNEWTELTNYLGGSSVAGGKLKEAGTTHWRSPNTGATNESGFTALPGNGRFSNLTPVDDGRWGYWWSSTQYDSNNAYSYYLGFNMNNIDSYGDFKDNGLSVRCIKGEIVATVPSVNITNTGTITASSCVLNGIVNSDGGSTIIACGFYWSETNPEPGPGDQVISIAGKTGEFSYNLTGLKPNTTYYYNAFATNSEGTGVSDRPKSFTTLKKTFTDGRDGHTYEYVVIGNQTWMAENLAYLPVVSPPSESDKYSPYYYVYQYNGNNVDDAKKTQEYKNFGVLYNLEAAKQACPAGWHLPTDDEWKELEIYIGMPLNEVDMVYYPRGTQGAKLKSSLSWAWIGGTGTDDYGFNALGSGMKDAYNEFQGLQTWGEWWSSTQEPGFPIAYVRILRNTSSDIWYTSKHGNIGLGVRCVKDK